VSKYYVGPVGGLGLALVLVLTQKANSMHCSIVVADLGGMIGS